jgi:benz_CoA_bzdQ: benzoyl-CoA reductase, bzd-type, Q subunit
VRIVTTGYGRAYIDSGDDSITEITCHAKGAHYLNPNVRTVIDIGGQDIKAISIDENGAVKNFLMNDKCAAGTGRFLEMMARTLGPPPHPQEPASGWGRFPFTALESSGLPLQQPFSGESA